MKYPEISDETKKYWTEEERVLLDNAKTIHEVFTVASTILDRMPKELAQVCGPITNGGKGSIEANLEYLNLSIQKLQQEGIHVFDQMPYEETFHRIVADPLYSQKYENILDDFYEPLFATKRISTLYFVKGWEGSRGAKWEHTRAVETGMQIVYL